MPYMHFRDYNHFPYTVCVAHTSACSGSFESFQGGAMLDYPYLVCVVVHFTEKLTHIDYCLPIFGVYNG